MVKKKRHNSHQWLKIKKMYLYPNLWPKIDQNYHIHINHKQNHLYFMKRWL
jgi:hypothetical protein